MKKILLALIFLLAFGFSMVWAASNVCLEWSPNTEQDIAKYKAYQSASLFDPNLVPDQGLKVGEVDHPATEIVIVVQDGMWFWAVTAVDIKNNESNPSNDVTESLDTEPPAPPQNLIIKWIAKIIAWLRVLIWRA